MIKLILNKSLVKVEDADDEIYKQLNQLLSYTINNVYFIPAFRNGGWDGKTRLFNIRSNTFRIGLLTRVVEYFKLQNIEFEIVDNRKLEFDYDFTVLDKKFVYDKKSLRDTQIEGIRSYIEPYEGTQLNRGMIVMPPRSGKCVHRHSKVFTPNQGYINIQDIQIGDLIYGEKDKKLIINRVVGKSHSKINSYLKIKTRSGRIVKLSKEHRLFTEDGYKEAKDIMVGNFLYTLNTKIDGKIIIDDDELKFISYMIFEGCCRDSFSFTNYDLEIMIDFISTCNNLGIKTTPKKYVNNQVVEIMIQTHPDSLSFKLINKYGLYYKLAKEKRLPIDFFKLSLKQKYIFLGVMFTTDGGFDEDKAGTIGLASEGLIDDIQMLLSTCGIVSNKRYKLIKNKFHCWSLNIGRSYLTDIYNNCDLKHKKEKCARILEKKGQSLTNIYPHKFVNKLKNTRNNGFRIDNKKNITEERLLKIGKIYPEVLDYLNKDFFWDCVVSKEKIIDKSALYDVETSDSNNFILEGVVSHNSLTAGVLATVINRYPVLFTVHTIDIAMQTKAVFDRVFNTDCGIIGDGKCNINEFVNVSTIQSIASAFRIKEDVEKGDEEKGLKNYSELKNLINRTKTLIIDEAHASSTDMYTELPKYIDNLEHIIGLTGTPFREDGDDMLLEQMCGSIIYELDRQTAIDKGYLLETDLYFVSTPQINISKHSSQSQESLGIDENMYLNKVIVDLVNVLEKKGTSTVIIVKHRKQGKILADDLGCMYLNGSTSGEDRQQVYKQLNDKKILTIVSTVTGIGVDIPTLDNVIIASLGTSKVQAFQRIRCNTPSEGKECGNVFVMIPNIHIPEGKKDYMKVRYKKLKNIYKKEKGINVYDISYEDIK